MSSGITSVKAGNSGTKALPLAEDQILLLLGYYPEYGSLLSAGTEFGLSQSPAYTLISGK